MRNASAASVVSSTLVVGYPRDTFCSGFEDDKDLEPRICCIWAPALGLLFTMMQVLLVPSRGER